MRVWLDSLQANLSGARAILKLGPTQEVAVPVQPLGEGLGRLGRGAVSLSPIWKMKDGMCVAGPSPPCIFVQIWQEAELCGLAKLVLSQLASSTIENINLKGCEEIFQEDAEVLAVSTNRSIGKLRVLLHAGLEPILEALPEPQPTQLPKPRNHVVTEAAAAMMTLCCLSVEALESLETDLKRRKPVYTKGAVAENAEKTWREQPVDPAILIAYQPLLSSEEADSLVLWLEETEGPVWSTLKSKIQAVHESFDQLIKEVGDECTSVALDFLDVAAPAKLQRQDVARVLKFRGIELGWNTLEQIFMALGCSDSSSDSSQLLLASSFSRLFKARAERRMVEVARLRQLEAKVLGWWRWQDKPVGSSAQALDLVSAYSKSDGTVDLMGLKVLLASGPFQQDEVENLAQWLFEGFGARPGGGVPKDMVLQWLTGKNKTDSVNKDETCNEAEKTPQKHQSTVLPAAKVESEKPMQVPVSSHPEPATANLKHTGHIPLDLQEVALDPFPNGRNQSRCPEEMPVLQVSQATIQLSKPLKGRHAEALGEVLASSLKHPLHQIKVFGGEEGSSRICVVIQSDQLSTSEAAMRDLALQLKDPSSSLRVPALVCHLHIGLQITTDINGLDHSRDSCVCVPRFLVVSCCIILSCFKSFLQPEFSLQGQYIGHLLPLNPARQVLPRCRQR